MNLITPAKRAGAARLVRTGRTVSLSRDLPTTPGPGNPNPTQHYVKRLKRGDAGGGAAIDYFAIGTHGTAATHLDALCHIWDENGIWNGRDPDKVLTFDGATWGGIDQWRDGIMTRGVLLDVPKHRRQPFVTLDAPVHGWELEEIAQSQGVTIEPGDAVLVYSGREAWNRANPPYSSDVTRPGLHASCLEFIHRTDCSLLVWDMLDMSPSGYDLPWTVHGALMSYGIGLVDNALLEPIARVCAEESRYEFMLVVLPLALVGGTGSPVNPVAFF